MLYLLRDLVEMHELATTRGAFENDIIAKVMMESLQAVAED